MKPSAIHIRLTALLAAVLTATASTADVFILKDGTRLEGSILSDRGDSYLLEIQVTRSIKDERVVAKEDILRIERERPDVTAFEALSELWPIPDLLTPDDYAARIERLNEFLKEHATSQKAREVTTMLATHEEEAAVIAAGGVKLGGNLIAADERAANAYEIDSRVAETNIRNHVRDGSLLSALREFQQFDADFAGSEAWHSLLPLMQQVIAAHRTQAQEMIDGHDEMMSRQQAGLSRMSPADRVASERAVAERDAALKHRFDAETRERIGWPTPHTNFKPSLEATVRHAEQESRRLETAAAQPRKDPLPCAAWRAAFAAIKSGDEAKTREAISTARTAGVSASYIERLEQQAAR